MNDDKTCKRLLKEGLDFFCEGRFQEALGKFAQALARQPQNVEALFWVAASTYHLGNLPEAKNLLERVRALRTPPLPDRPAAVHEYLVRCFLKEDPRRAIALGEEGVSRDANDGRMRVLLGDAYSHLHQSAEALLHYTKARELEQRRGGEPVFPDAPGQVPFARSTSLVKLKRWEEALEEVEEALRREPRNALFHNRRSIILFDGLQDPKAAVEAVQKAIALDPETLATGKDGVYYYNLAHYRHNLGEIEKARDALDRAIAVSPMQPYKEFRDNLLALTQKTPVPPSIRATSAKVTFASVGGMHALKEQVRRIVAVIHLQREKAKQYGIVRNGILLYGPPGCGKSFFAQAIAGEFSLNYVPVSLASALSKWVGSAGETMEKVFQQAKEKVPCVLFLDEMDALAGRRRGAGSQHEQQVVNALLQQIDAHRDVPGLILVAATNRLDEIDPAVIREGRFDYKVKIYKADFDARREILQVLLQDRPHDASFDPTSLAQDMEGCTAAQIRHVVDEAALAAMEAKVPITQEHLRDAYRRLVVSNKYRGPQLAWDGLILPEETRQKLQFIENFIENPDLARSLGIDPPRGVLLFGPPGTGKTTIARVLASETDASFYAINAADIFSKWLGESEQRVKELFEKARDSVPALIFIDEVEALLGRRGAAESSGEQVRSAVTNVFLAEMDGLDSSGRVFIIGATNRPELIDEAALRPGRLSEAIEIGLPGLAERAAMLGLFGKKMNLDETVDFQKLAADTEGASGADLRGLCTAAGRNAFLRALGAPGVKPNVTGGDFEKAAEEFFSQENWIPSEKDIGFQAKEE